MIPTVFLYGPYIVEMKTGEAGKLKDWLKETK